ncbi:hypothetical protein EVAR_96156_1 [Eumeta japonica]|uniref:Uncharacterized protein n=1 Tax=Eumeta variegata TaxID=151549 RepID=A0A4C1VL14_EUMVA|nr:hypothetical protein EVAR_96156_1 [Eumeta japonica]
MYDAIRCEMNLAEIFLDYDLEENKIKFAKQCQVFTKSEYITYTVTRRKKYYAVIARRCGRRALGRGKQFLLKSALPERVLFHSVLCFRCTKKAGGAPPPAQITFPAHIQYRQISFNIQIQAVECAAGGGAAGALYLALKRYDAYTIMNFDYILHVK